MKATTTEGKKLERNTTRGLDGFSLMFANSINYDALAEAIKSGKF